MQHDKAIANVGSVMNFHRQLFWRRLDKADVGKRHKLTEEKDWQNFRGSALESLWACHTPDHHDQTADASVCDHQPAPAQSNAEATFTHKRQIPVALASNMQLQRQLLISQ